MGYPGASISTSHIPFKEGVEAVFRHSGFVVTRPFDRPSQTDFAVASGSEPIMRYAVACVEDTSVLTTVALEIIAAESQRRGYNGVQIISNGHFGPETLQTSRELGVQLIDKNGYQEAISQLPSDVLEGFQLEPNQSTQPVVPPPIPSITSPHPNGSTTPAATGKTPKWPIVLAVVGALALFLVVIAGMVAGIVMPNIARINEAAVEAQDRRNAQQLASVANAAQAAGLDFVALAGSNDVGAVLANVAQGAKIDDPGNHFHGTFFGAPNLSDVQIAAASKYITISQGMVFYTEDSQTENSQEVLFQAIAESMEQRRLSNPSVNELQIPIEAPTWASQYQDNRIRFLRELWRLDEIGDPKIASLGEAFLLAESKKGGDYHPEIYSRSIRATFANADTYPRLAYALVNEVTGMEQQRVISELLPRLQAIGDPMILFQVKALRAGETKTPEHIKSALAQLQILLNESKGLEDFDDATKVWMLMDHFAADFFCSEHARMVPVVDDHPDLPSWLKDLFVGKHHVRSAWEARGSGWANTVSADGWLGFEEHLELARERLTRSWNSNPDHPAAAARMITVSMGMNGAADMRLWFDRAIAARADYGLAYHYYLNGMQARWHGSDAELAAIGKACLETERFDTSIPGFLLLAHDYRANSWKDKHQYWAERSFEEIDELVALFAGLEASPERESWRNYDRSHAAVIWYLCGEYDRMAECLEQVGELSSHATKRWGVPKYKLIHKFRSMRG